MTATKTSPTNILTISLAQHLHGYSINESLDLEWSHKVDPSTRATFNNVGFDVDPNDVPKMLEDLQQTLRGRHWDGVTIGWCTRGYKERTELFEQIMDVCVDETRGDVTKEGRKTKLVFCTGPDDLAASTLRNFPIA